VFILLSNVLFIRYLYSSIFVSDNIVSDIFGVDQSMYHSLAKRGFHIQLYRTESKLISNLRRVYPHLRSSTYLSRLPVDMIVSVRRNVLQSCNITNISLLKHNGEIDSRHHTFEIAIDNTAGLMDSVSSTNAKFPDGSLKSPKKRSDCQGEA